MSVIPGERPSLLSRIGSEVARARAILGLALVVVIFQAQNANFLTPFNITNMLLQVAAVGVLSIGVVFVLLIGEIDLSVGVVSGFTSAVMAALIINQGQNPYFAIAVSLALGGAIGLAQGLAVTFFRIPSFVVTLAGLLIWAGCLLLVLGIGGSVSVYAPEVQALTRTFIPTVAGWVLVGIFVAVSLILAIRSALRAGTSRGTRIRVLVGAALISAFAVVLVAALNADRGLPVAFLILLGLVIVWQYVAARTAFGRHIFATGGNAEAARRAGIRIQRVRVAAFGIAGLLAAASGVLAASRLQSVGTTSGGSDLLLFAIAGPVIAGTSLFGGRGSVWSALFGALVIGAISNGMDLLNFEPAAKSIVTGLVLLLAVIIDALSRRASGPTKV